LNAKLNGGFGSGTIGECSGRRLRRIDRSGLRGHIGGWIEPAFHANMAADVRPQTLASEPVGLLVLAVHEHVLIEAAINTLNASGEVELFRAAR
jgi:hypothetical protein